MSKLTNMVEDMENFVFFEEEILACCSAILNRSAVHQVKTLKYLKYCIENVVDAEMDIFLK